MWVNGGSPGLEPGRCRFDSCHPDEGRKQARRVSRPREARRQGCALGRRDALQATRGGFDSLAVHTNGPVDYLAMSAPPQGAGPGSTPGRVTTSHWSTRRRMPDFQSGERGSTPRWDTDSRVLPNGRQPVLKTGVVVSSPRGSIPPLSS